MSQRTYPVSQRDSYAPSANYSTFQFKLPAVGTLRGPVALEGDFFLSAAPGGPDVYINGSIGVHSIISTLRVMNSSGAVIEEIKHYNRLMAALVAGTMSTPDSALSSTGALELRAGSNACSRGLIATALAAAPASFSMVPFSGFLNTAAMAGVDLSRFGGLIIEVELEQDLAVLAGSQVGAVTYALADVALCYYVEPATAPAKANSKLPPIAFRSYWTQYTTLESGRSAHTTKVPSKAVLSAFQSYISRADAIDQTKDAMELQSPPELKSITFEYAGMTFPFSEPLVPSQDQAQGSVLGAIIDAAAQEAITGEPVRYGGPSPLSTEFATFNDMALTGCRYSEPIDMTAANFGVVIESGASNANSYNLYMHFAHEVVVA